MVDTFDFCPGLDSQGTITQKVQTSDFGDGYSQATSVGINNQYEQWNITITGKASTIAPVRAFLDTHKGDQSFYWTPPNGKQGRYRSSEYQLTPQGNDVYRLTSTLTQVFDASSNAASEYVKTVNAIGPDADGNVTLTAIDVGADDRGAAAAAITALKAEDDPLPQYAKKSDIPDLDYIDEKFTELDGEISTINTNITNLTSDLGTTNNNLTALEGRVTTAEINISNLTTTVDSHTGQIANLQTDVSTNTTDIDEIKSSMVKSVNNVLPDTNGNVTLTIDSESEIDDSQISLTKTWSSQKINQISVDLANNTEQDKGAGKVGFDPSLAYPQGTIGDAIKNSGGLPLFSVLWWPSRDNIPAGFIAADGQELSQATYPDAAQGITDNKVPTVTNDVWLSNLTTRGCYVATSSDGNFRLPDYNGKQANSLGALFLRGDNGLVSNGVIQLDELRSHTHSYQSRNTSGATAGAGGLQNLVLGTYQTGATGGDETRPINVSGCWVIKLFGSITNVGSADAAQLASDYANLAARVSVLESWKNEQRFTYIYPNGGTAESPANVSSNNRYVTDNPFPNEPVICIAEVQVNDQWGDPNFALYSTTASYGVRASMLDDSIIIQTGSSGVTYLNSGLTGAPFGTITTLTSAPCRVKIWRIK